MTTTQTGRAAEDAAAKYLQKNGFKIVDQNWRTRWCEIDIVATKKKVVYFVEVKYRKSSKWGDGLDAITDKKFDQMTYAAEIWICDNDWMDDYELAVISATGEPPKVTDFIVV